MKEYGSAECGWCGDTFFMSQHQRFNNRHGKNVYCSLDCRIRGKGQVRGGHFTVCKMCGKEFYSRIRGKIYCGMKCYQEDPETKVRLRATAKKGALAVAKLHGYKTIERVTRKCAYCGAELILKPSSVGKRNYCNHSHYRLYMADRFDRWIASPQTIALPQNYDEFLTQEELPCLIEGCDWTGKNLSFHMNMEHGVQAEQFKRIAGFNLRSGIVSLDLSDKMRNSALARIAQMGMCRPLDNSGGLHNPYLSLEAKEHHAKAMALIKADPISKTRSGFCRWCGKEVPQPVMGKKLYCSSICRSRFYSRKQYGLICYHCSNRFLGTSYQFRQFRKGNPIYCSKSCAGTVNGGRPKHRKKEEAIF